MAAEAQHIFCVCQPGAEAALKAEVAARAPTLRFGFSRPGFVTFKLPEPAPVESIELPPFVFARTQGVSLGKVTGAENAVELAADLWALPAVQNLPFRSLHVWQREARLPGANGIEPGRTPLTEVVEKTLRATLPAEHTNRLSSDHQTGEGVEADNRFSRGAFALDIALVEPNEWWVGCHRLQSRVGRWPGGVPAIELPGHAVSRAYLKMSEALRWAAPPMGGGELWVELGCAPGGASQALIDAGMYVLGVDPAEVDPVVLADERFAHLRGRASEIRRKELNDARWLAADINAAPDYTLDAVESVVTHPDAHFRGLLLTLKLPDWSQATPERLAAYAARLRGWGFRDVRMRQLAFNRQEMCVAALRSRSQRRLRR